MDVFYSRNDDTDNKRYKIRRKELIAMAIVTAVLAILSFQFQTRTSKQLRLNHPEGEYICLSNRTNADSLKNLLLNGYYIQDKADAQFIADSLVEKLQTQELPNLGSLNKRAFRIPADSALKYGGEGLKSRVYNSYLSMGLDSLLNIPKQNIGIPEPAGDYSIIVEVKAEKGKQLSDSIYVKLTVFYPSQNHPEVLYDEEGTLIPQRTCEVYYQLLSDGHVVFSNLDPQGSYSVVPVKRGSEFGTAKGTTHTGRLIDETSYFHKTQACYSFVEKPNKIKLFESSTYTLLRSNNALTVRTAEDYRQNFISHILLFFISFWLVHILWGWKRQSANELILPFVMFLCGVSIICIYAFFKPLQDLLQGASTANGVLIGLVALACMSFLDIFKFGTQDITTYVPFMKKQAHSRYKWLSSKWFPLSRNFISYSSGYNFLVIGIALQFLLLLFGSGPEGSGVKVNLGPIQPSEITKYLVVLFFSFYFARNAKLLSQIPVKRRISRTILMIVLFGTLMLIYLMLGDMGPALVLSGTFIYFYALARGDFKQLAIGVVSFLILITLVNHFGHSLRLYLVAIGVWGILFAIYCLVKKDFFESPVFMNTILSIFILVNVLPFQIHERLSTRCDMWQHPFDTHYLGGTQVAEGIWGLTSGGLWGQGIAQGHANVIPAGHTDMILCSIGEEGGWFMLALIVVAMALLLHRCMLTGRNSATPFLFYLASGIAIITGLQFFVIGLGCVGVIPLTGINVPLLSYGSVGMITTMASLGCVVAASTYSPSKSQIADTQETYDNSIVYSMLTFAALFVILLGVFAKYQVFQRNSYIVKPAFAVNREGTRIVDYNPRINILLNNLNAGNITDRNGLILATSSKESLDFSQYKDLTSKKDFDRCVRTPRKGWRYYPLGMNTFFFVGDYNTKLFWNANDVSYNAESRHLSELRGFDVKKDDVLSNQLRRETYNAKEGMFMPKRSSQNADITVYDYSDKYLVRLLKAGEGSRKFKRYQKKVEKRSISLTIDASLQVRLQDELDKYLNEKIAGGGWRTSVVIVDAKHGDVLASATYPLPNTEDLLDFSNLYCPEDNFIQNKALAMGQINGRVFTNCDLGITYATPPGSTAKIMSGLSALMKDYTAKDAIIEMVPEESIHGTHDWGKAMQMEEAISRSINPFFIHIINDYKTDEELLTLYKSAGIRIGNYGSDYFDHWIYNDEESCLEEWKSIFLERREIYDTDYKQAIEKGAEELGYNQYKSMIKRGLRSEFSYLAWGQGQMQATPLSIARVMATVANDGTMVHSRYLLKGKTQKEDLFPSKIAASMRSFLSSPTYAKSLSTLLGKDCYAKTGTPEKYVLVKQEYLKRAQAETLAKRYSHRILEQEIENRVTNFSVQINSRTIQNIRIIFDKDGNPVHAWRYTLRKMNDAWLVFYTNDNKGNPIVVCVRIERPTLYANTETGASLGGETATSAAAIALSKEVIVPVLNNYFSHSEKQKKQ